MKRIIRLSILLLGGLAANAIADNCTGDTTASRVNPGVLADMRVSAIAPDGEVWTEDHCGNQNGGALFKVGTTDGPPKHPERDSVDPRVQRGTWTRTSMPGGPIFNITYDYDPGDSYTFELWLAGSTYYFCTVGASTTEVAHTTAVTPFPC